MKLVMVGLLLTLFTSAAFSANAQQITKPAKKTDAVESDPVFQFNGKLEFEGKVVRGSIRKSEIDALLARRVVLLYAPSDAAYGLDFSFQEGHFPAFSCREWVQA